MDQLVWLKKGTVEETNCSIEDIYLLVGFFDKNGTVFLVIFFTLVC